MYKEETSTVAMMVSGGREWGEYGSDHIKEMVCILDMGGRDLTKGWRWASM